MQEDKRNEFVDLEPYLFPATKRLLEEIESKKRIKVHLRKVYDPIESWQINILRSNVIDMPSWDEENNICFTHELLHIYFDFALGMKVERLRLLSLVQPYGSYFEDPWYLPNQYINLINNLQHHKMVPYYEEYNFPINKIIDNYENPDGVFKAFDESIQHALDLTNPCQKYLAALSYVNFLALELYFPNPAVREIILKDYSKKIDDKFVGLRKIFQPLLKKWDTEYHDLPQMIDDIDKKAKEYAEVG